MTKAELDIFTNYFKNKFNHTISIIEIFKTDRNPSWRGFRVKCNTCQNMITVFIAAEKCLSDLSDMTDKLIKIKNTKINFIMYDGGGDPMRNIRDYSFESDLLKCEDVIIKNIIE